MKKFLIIAIATTMIACSSNTKKPIDDIKLANKINHM